MSILETLTTLKNINQLMDRLQKNTIGMDDYFDRVFGVEAKSYPPYNLVQVNEDESHLEMASLDLQIKRWRSTPRRGTSL